jgi:DNA-directed RNA polymerase subunit H (RpoH/RPB5)
MNNNLLQNPMRILTYYEKTLLSDYYYHSGTNIHCILEEDLISRSLNARIGDIICIYEPKRQVYRLVI